MKQSDKDALLATAGLLMFSFYLFAAVVIISQVYLGWCNGRGWVLCRW